MNTTIKIVRFSYTIIPHLIVIVLLLRKFRGFAHAFQLAIILCGRKLCVILTWSTCMSRRCHHSIFDSMRSPPLPPPRESDLPGFIYPTPADSIWESMSEKAWTLQTRCSEDGDPIFSIQHFCTLWCSEIAQKLV